MMKKVIVACLIAVGLVGCDEPVPLSQWVQTQFDLKQVQGLEDCKYFGIKPNTNSHTIHVIRCPLSSVSAEWNVQQGKTTVPMRSVTVDENRVRELEQKASQAKSAYERYLQELEDAKAGK